MSGVTGASKNFGSITISGTETSSVGSHTISSNTDVAFKLKCNGTSYELSSDGETLKTGTNSIISDLKYVAIREWSGQSQTVTLTDLKIKPL